MSPLRWDVLVVSLLLALPVLALGLRGEFTVEEVTGKLPWCLAAGWAVVALLRAVVAQPAPEQSARIASEARSAADHAADGEPAPST